MPCPLGYIPPPLRRLMRSRLRDLKCQAETPWYRLSLRKRDPSASRCKPEKPIGGVRAGCPNASPSATAVIRGARSHRENLSHKRPRPSGFAAASAHRDRPAATARTKHFSTVNLSSALSPGPMPQLSRMLFAVLSAALLVAGCGTDRYKNCPSASVIVDTSVATVFKVPDAPPDPSNILYTVALSGLTSQRHADTS